MNNESSKTNNHLSLINNHFALGSSTFVESALQIHPFLQNKPNFKKSQMNVNKVLTRDYEKRTLGERGKTNPKQTQNKAKTNPNKANFHPKNQLPPPKQTQTNPKQTQFQRQKKPPETCAQGIRP
jgi:hypothetical protein